MTDCELIFLGTGTSSSVPSVACLTDPESTCRACLASLTPEGKKNIRRNTCAVFRLDSRKGAQRKVTIVVDVGKDFQAAAIEHFRARNLRKIDALIITHPHADACHGLDDIRAWTTGSDRVQDHVDVYLTPDTFNAIQSSFPYMVHKEYATGGGDTPDFKWHIIEDKVPFEIEETGIFITPFRVQHGWIFAPPRVDHTTTADTSSKTPFWSLGLKLEDKIVYISDVSCIPADVWPIISDVPICVLDCLHLRRHPSHFALDESIPTAKKINAQRTYLTGFSHRVSHEEYVAITEFVGGQSLEREAPLSETLIKAMDLLAGTEMATEPIWVRPAYDGLKVSIKDGTIEDDCY